MATCNHKCKVCCPRSHEGRSFCQLCGAHKFRRFMRASGNGWRCRGVKKCKSRGANYRK